MKAFVIPQSQRGKKFKTQDVIKHLRVKGSITSLEAFELYDVTRLSSIIFNLRKKGYDIKTETQLGKNKYGNTMSYAKYILEEDKSDED